MKKNELNKSVIKSTFRKALKGTNRIVHAHYHAG